METGDGHGIAFLKNLFLCRELSVGIKSYCGDASLESFEKALAGGKFGPWSRLKCWFRTGMPTATSFWSVSWRLNVQVWLLKNRKYFYDVFMMQERYPSHGSWLLKLTLTTKWLK